mmetsp:Transcript_101166/g.291302  ORF Transcript_101166/g.291302 Transcript_101166/m.291302 type:complete len:201 (-) Transcript_101166:956-1558(-)
MSLIGTPSRRTTSKCIPAMTPPVGSERHWPTHGGTNSPWSAAASSPTMNSIGSRVLSNRRAKPSLVFARPKRVSTNAIFGKNFATRKCATNRLRLEAAGGPRPFRNTRSHFRPSPFTSVYSLASRSSTSMRRADSSSPLADGDSGQSSSGKPRICSACRRRAVSRMSSGTSLNISLRLDVSGSHADKHCCTAASTEAPSA